MRQPISEALAPGLSSLVFIAIPVGILIAKGSLDWVGWFALAFGTLGLVASVALVMGWTIAPRSRTRRSAPRGQRIKPVHHKGPLPELSVNKQVQVRRVVKVMAQAGVFATTPPDPALLYAGAAEMGWSIQPDVILLALQEADYYHPGFDPAPHFATLAFHDIQVETPAERIEAMIRDLERLSVGALVIADLRVAQDIVDADARTVRTSATLTINGMPLSVTEDHHFNYFPLGLHRALAAHMPPDRRFAWLWVDQGAFVTALPPRAVEAMNEALKLTPKSRCFWDWITDIDPPAPLP
ncbi:hypothetical protein ABS767_00890 [Sphingomonas sp. ST-64]|uniref:Uncharacterized protein n=1 Tax=Sphingomonas plantiphila TaxID=3163295 RepID=A0ABW8YGY2_9SPHN